MQAQKATDLRRLLAEVEANERSLRLRQDELEGHLAGAPAASWEEAAVKARYVLGLYAATLTAAHDTGAARCADPRLHSQRVAPRQEAGEMRPTRGRPRWRWPPT
jgi:hypothetical protein